MGRGKRWIPACAGMTTALDTTNLRITLDSRLRGNDSLVEDTVVLNPLSDCSQGIYIWA